MNFLLLLGFLVSGNMLSAGPSLRADELLMAQAEAKAYRAAWLELQRRDEILGIAALSSEIVMTRSPAFPGS
jgi:hypothetical protein